MHNTQAKLFVLAVTFFQSSPQQALVWCAPFPVQEKVAQFTAATGTDATAAVSFLKKAHWDLNSGSHAHAP